MIIAAIDLIDGCVVRLKQGDYARRSDFDFKPVAQFQHYEAQGAECLHLVDLTGAKDPARRQLALIAEMAQAVKVPVQTGGGIRSVEDVRALLTCGIDRVVVGSMAVKAPETVKAWFEEFGADRLVLALDVQVDADGVARVATGAWQQTSHKTIEEVIEEFLPLGLKHVLCTDIACDGMMTGTNVALYRRLTQAYPQIAFQASGGIGSLQDIENLKGSGVAGIIVGRALLQGTFTLKEAISCWQSE